MEAHTQSDGCPFLYAIQTSFFIVITSVVVCFITVKITDFEFEPDFFFFLLHACHEHYAPKRIE